ncbi:cytochrome P450 [Trametes polyzona]|nr:cytochrome P450 [Trametes polyzona]
MRLIRACGGKPPLPPGPPRLPLLGNALSIPTRRMAQVYYDMSVRHGDLMYLESFGQPIIVLGTYETAFDLLDKRSAKYADKVHSTMAKIAGWDWALPIMTYGMWWRRSRKAFHEFFSSAAIVDYRPIQLECAQRLISRLAKDPKRFSEHIRHCIGSGILRIAYGIDIEKENIPYMTIAEEALTTFAATFVPGKYLVETFPVLRLLPSWFPGARFKREGAAWKKKVQRLRDTPWDAAIAAMREGTAPASMATIMMERTPSLQGEDLIEEREIAKSTVGALYSTTMTFILAMASFPDIQKKAQAELDTVVGPHRLPDFDDQHSLPYIAAIVKECVRWRPVLTLGIAHRSMEEDEYRGYHIPKGTLMIPNVWAYTRDTRDYPDPEAFRPERFLKEDGSLNPDVLDPGDFAFGFGRRRCPGRDFGLAFLFAFVSHVLHTLEIGPPKDDLDGRALPLDAGMTDGGVLSLPEPFECTIAPRSAETVALFHACQ